MPSLQQQAIKMTREALDGLFKAASFVPADKQADWKPMGEARSALSQLVECALTPYFFMGMLKGEKPEDQQKLQEAELTITTVEAAKAAALKNHELLYAVIAAIPDSERETEHPFPWKPGATVTTADMLFFAYWNLVYHLGQINYIQLMLGDTDMHM